MLLEDTVKTATAARSREIFLAFGNTGLFSPQLLCSSRLYEVDPSPRLWPAAVWLKRAESNFSRCAATHPPKGKATHCILSRLRLLTARLSATHNNLSVASLLQIVFAAVTAVRCAPLTRSPNRLRDESVSLDFRSPSAPYKSSSLTFPLQAREGQLLRRSRWTSTLNSQLSTLSLSAIMTIY